MSMIWKSSVLFDLRNFFLAGVLKNKSLTSTDVPIEGESFISFTSPPYISTDIPTPPLVPPLLRGGWGGEFFSPVMSLTFETDAIDERASPLNPIVFILNRSSSLESLLVACLWKQRRASSLSIPSPLSDTLMRRFPP